VKPEKYSNGWALEGIELLKADRDMSFRRYVPAQGYASPNLIQFLMGGTFAACKKLGRYGKPSDADVTVAAAAVTLMKLEWPCYAILPDLADALAETDPPSDMTWNEIEWPLPAATFLLPLNPAMAEHFICPLSAVTLTIAKAVSPLVGPWGKIEFKSPGEHVLLVTTYREPGGMQHVSSVALPEHPMSLMGESEGHWDKPEVAAMTPEDLLRQRRVAGMAATILGFMASGYEPKLLKALPGDMLRPPSASKKHPHPALYGVRWLGVGYRRKGPPLGGHHASPAVHWRRGHFRSQPYGPGRALRRPRWIEPMMVGAETAEPVKP